MGALVIDLKAKLIADAHRFLDAGDFEHAAPALEHLIRYAREDSEAVKFAHVNLAAHYFQIDDSRAIDHFRAALEVDPEDHRVRYCLGHAHLDAEQFAEAATAFEGAVSRRPEDAEYRRSYGVALAEDGRLEDALAQLFMAARTKPGEAFVLKDLAQVLGACGRYDEALRHIRRAVALAPDEPFFGEVLEELLHQQEVERLIRTHRSAKPESRPRNKA